MGELLLGKCSRNYCNNNVIILSHSTPALCLALEDGNMGPVIESSMYRKKFQVLCFCLTEGKQNPYLEVHTT